MKRLIVGSLEAFSTLTIVVMIVGGGIAGFTIGHQAHNPFLALAGGVIGFVVAFVIAVLTFGVLFTLLEINEHLAAIRATSAFGGPTHLREPHF
jgi:hypothetical protein